MSEPVLIEIREPSGATRICEFRDRHAMAAGLRIGSGAACELRLAEASVAEVHAVLRSASVHWLLYLAEDGELPQQYTRRVDYGAFDVGGYAIRVLPPSDWE